MDLDHPCLCGACRNTLSHRCAQDLVNAVHGGHAQEAGQGAVFPLGGALYAPALLGRHPQGDGLLGLGSSWHGLTCSVGLS